MSDGRTGLCEILENFKKRSTWYCEWRGQADVSYLLRDKKSFEWWGQFQLLGLLKFLWLSVRSPQSASAGARVAESNLSRRGYSATVANALHCRKPVIERAKSGLSSIRVPTVGFCHFWLSWTEEDAMRENRFFNLFSSASESYSVDMWSCSSWNLWFNFSLQND